MSLLWSLYFLAKLASWAQGSLSWSALGNLAVLATLGLLAGARIGAHSRWPGLRRWLAWGHLPLGLAALVLWTQELGLPPPVRWLDGLAQVADFSLDYLLELSNRLLPWRSALLALALLPLLYLLNLRLRLLVWVGVLVVGGSVTQMAWGIWTQWTGPALTQPGDLAPRQEQWGPEIMALGLEGVRQLQALRDQAQQLSEAQGAALEAAPSAAVFNRFVRDQSQLHITLPPMAQQAAPFDLVLLHVCSLSWDDLQSHGLDRHPVLQRFDVLFQRFNSATSYSGPAAIRLLRASCGQPRHDALYQAAEPGCLLFGQLAQLGFTPQVLMNHDGRFDQFRQQVLTNLGVAATEAWADPRRVRAGLQGFDGAPLAADGALLQSWWQARLQRPEPAVALYYNSISLHDGNRPVGGDARSSRAGYPQRARQWLDDVQQTLDLISRSGRRALVLMVPEHGAALGEHSQLAGLRELPTPDITLVPAGLAWIDPDRPSGARATQLVPQTVSYTALARIVENWLRHGHEAAFVEQPQRWLADLPSVRMVAENEAALVMEQGGQLRQRLGRGPATAWSVLP